MSEFHRMITYLYLYEQGVKNRNIGFAKVEKREQRCLLEIHMKNTGYSICPIPVYFYIQQQETLVGIPLGNFGLTRGNGEFKTVLDAGSLKGSPYTLDAVKGIYIPLTERTMLVSQWDDDEFQREHFVDISDLPASAEDSKERETAHNSTAPLPQEETASTPPLVTPSIQQSGSPKHPRTGAVPQKASFPAWGVNPKKPIKAASLPAASALPNGNTASETPQSESTFPQNTPAASPAQATDATAKDLNPVPKVVAHISSDSKSAQQTEAASPQVSKPLPQNNASVDAAPISEQEAQKQPQEMEISEALAEESESPPSGAMVSTAANCDTSESSKPAKEPPKAMDALKALEALPRQEYRTGGFHSVSRTTASANTRNHAKNQPNPEHTNADTPEDWSLRWRFILENYPVMTPFSGDENTLCVRLELKDLRQLPKQFWYLGNNSFLLHGFFNYRYLILGMTQEYGVKKWFIGIPGVFQNPERVMAALFGFPEFRREKPSPINTGEFGYWYRYLNELSQPSDNESS